jgi:hypothetical protein
LISGKTTTIDLAKLLGPSTDLLGASFETITWLGDGSDILISPSEDATPTRMGSSNGSASCARSYSGVSPTKATCLILVHFDASTRTLTSRMVVDDDLGLSIVLSGADREPLSLVGATFALKPNVYQMTLSGSRIQVNRLLTLPMVLPVAFDLLGSHIFYIVGHGPTALWVATISSGHLAQPHRLIANAELGSMAW